MPNNDKSVLPRRPGHLVATSLGSLTAKPKRQRESRPYQNKHPEAAAPEPQPEQKMVLCPKCGLPCSLMPLKRPGGYRLVDPDGHGHFAVCIADVAPTPKPVRYQPVEGERRRA